MANKRPFREFLYLDVPKVESLISQLDEGLSKDQTSQKSTQNRVSGGGSIAQLLNLSGEHGRTRSLQETKVLHDFAFNRAKKLLHDHNLVLSSEELRIPFDAETLPFIAAVGEIAILDHEMLGTVEKVAKAINDTQESGLFPSEAGSNQSQMPDPAIFGLPAKVLSEMWGDVVLSRMTDPQHNAFTMIMRRPFLREDSLAFVMRYGFRPIGKWNALGLITAVPTAAQAKEVAQALANPSLVAADSIMQTMLPVLELATKLMFSVSGVQPPDIAFDPIAVYREVAPLP